MNHHKPKMTKCKTLSIKNGLLNTFLFKANNLYTPQIYQKSYFLLGNVNLVTFATKSIEIISKDIVRNNSTLLHLIIMELQAEISAKCTFFNNLCKKKMKKKNKILNTAM